MKNVTESFRMVMQFISDQSLDIATIRGFLREKGVSNEDFDAARAELKARWTAATDPMLEQVRARHTAEGQRKLLDKAPATKQ